MHALLDVVLPVFLVIGAGYLAAWRGHFGDAAVDGLMRFAQNFAIPCLLFRAMISLDLSREFDIAMLGSFYLAGFASFCLGIIGARLLFDRPWQDCVSIGFCALFSNSVLLGLPITERAYGTEALAGNFAIIAFHAPVMYFIGITTMEIVRDTGGSMLDTARRVITAMFHNVLILAILLGLVMNLAGVVLPLVIDDATALLARAALPAALFGLGGVLQRYKPEGDFKVIVMVAGLSLIAHPAMAYGLSIAASLDRDALRSVVMTAAMAPGINTYIFANMFGAARRVAASAVLLSTTLSVLTVWVWLTILP